VGSFVANLLRCLYAKKFYRLIDHHSSFSVPNRDDITSRPARSAAMLVLRAKYRVYRGRNVGIQP